MALETFKGTFTAETGGAANALQAITGVGFQPKAILMWSDAQTAVGNSADLQFSKGFSDGTTDFCAGQTSEDNVATSNCGRMNSSKVISIYSVTPALLVEAELDSFDSDGFTVKWTTNDTTAYLIHYLAIGGDDLTNVDCSYFLNATVTGNQSITGVGFQPDCLIFLGTIEGAPPVTKAGAASLMFGAAVSSSRRFATGVFSEDAAAEADTSTSTTTSKCLNYWGNKGGTPTLVGQADFVSMDSDGFTIDWTFASVAAYASGFLALKGGQYETGADDSQTTAEADAQSITGVGFQPTGILFHGFNGDIDNSAVIGAASGAGVEGCVQGLDEDAISTTKANTRSSTTKVISAATSFSPTTTKIECDLTSFDSDGFTLTWTTKNASAILYRYLCMGDNPGRPGVALGSSNMGII